ncbi:MAG: Hsp20/alpha crystallin family protein [Planctomycetota bacterium]|nr:Hsp20/alpha crystallin family protein [Planctomycetota bacterium]
MLTVRTTPTVACRPAPSVFADLDRVFSGMFPGALAPWTTGTQSVFPAVNAWQDEKALYVEAELPGFKPADLDISVEGDELTIKGKREASVAPAGAAVVRRERWAGQFERTLRLPAPVDSDAVSASFNSGVLTITLPRRPETMPRKIRVNPA